MQAKFSFFSDNFAPNQLFFKKRDTITKKWREATSLYRIDLLHQQDHDGLLGMETSHSSYSPETIRLAEAIAAEFDLLPSGGSDFHGSVKPDIALGIGKGQLSIPPEVYSNLLAAWKALQT